MNMFIEEARQIAAQCWCDKETENIEMNAALAEAFAKRLSGWMDDVAREMRNVEFYRRLLDECVEHLGPFKGEAFIQDDGGVVDEPLRLKIPELVKKLKECKCPA